MFPINLHFGLSFLWLRIVKIYLSWLLKLSTLSVTVGTTPKIIRELIDGFKTDLVTKNLQVEHLVAEELGSNSSSLSQQYSHIKTFDDVLLSVLTSVEKEISLIEKLESVNPQLKAFYRGREGIAECAFIALCNLITPVTSEKSSLLSDEFYIILES